MSEESLVLLAQPEAGIAVLTFNRPQAMNTLDVPTAAAFQAACERLADDRSVRAIVLRGAGKAFGAGGDVASLLADVERIPTLIEHMHAGLRILATHDAPVVAGVHGIVAGGTLSLVAGCDFVIAAEGTKFNLGYANIGASCDVSGSWSLPRLVGLRKALEIALLSETFDAQEALRVGIVNRVVAPEALGDETLALARRLAAGATLAFGRIKRLMRQSFETGLDAHLDAERDAFRASSQTEDFREGTAAFLAKRKPVFTGR